MSWPSYEFSAQNNVDLLDIEIKTSSKPFVGKWSIVEMEAWDQEYIDIEVPGDFTFNKDGTGHFQFGLVQGEMDCRSENKGGKARIEFSWEGIEELDPATGRGWVVIEDEELKGRIFFHKGDDSVFRASRSSRNRRNVRAGKSRRV